VLRHITNVITIENIIERQTMKNKFPLLSSYYHKKKVYNLCYR